MAEIKTAAALDALTGANSAAADLFAIWDTSAATWKSVTRAELDKALAAWETKTASFAAVAGGRYACDTTSAGFTATLPASPAEGDEVWFDDFAGTWGTNALSIDPGSADFELVDGDTSAASDPMTCDAAARFVLKFTDDKWRVR